MSENREPEHEPYRRPDDLIGTLLGGTTEGLSEEERIMQKLLIEEYAKQEKSLLVEVRQWREAHPKATFGEAIRALYELRQNAENE